MSLSAAIITRLTNSTITALVADRVYPQYAREEDKVYPLIVYKVEGVQSYGTNDGPTGLQYADLHLAAIAPTQAQADTVVQAIQNLLDGDRGMWGTTVNMQGCFLKEDGISDDTETNEQNEEILFYIKEIVLELRYSNI